MILYSQSVFYKYAKAQTIEGLVKAQTIEGLAQYWVKKVLIIYFEI